MSNQTDHTIVRLRVPPELKQKIEKSAEESNRSQSAEMVARLEQSFIETKYSPEDLKMAVRGYLTGYYAGSAGAYKSRIDAFVAEHGEKPKNPSDQLFLQVLKILHSHYQNQLDEDFPGILNDKKAP
ncbi:Arc family DNA-binding protein [Acinetobacter sp. KS-LM10]|uniref:Arc family DNA-binding protein n=1 Tax=Acinetobacter sp. KS-LM10 TaxID=3120518 RepID=UPI00403F248D